jgi:hypothetical protein
MAFSHLKLDPSWKYFLDIQSKPLFPSFPKKHKKGEAISILSCKVTCKCIDHLCKLNNFCFPFTFCFFIKPFFLIHRFLSIFLYFSSTLTSIVLSFWRSHVPCIIFYKIWTCQCCSFCVCLNYIMWIIMHINFVGNMWQ